jgi:hypothetical protein
MMQNVDVSNVVASANFTFNGGGIYNTGTLTILNSDIYNNPAGFGGEL